MGFRWFTGQIVHFFCRQMKRWPVIVLAVARILYGNTIMSKRLHFFRISVLRKFSPKLSAVFLQLAACYCTLEPAKSRTPTKTRTPFFAMVRD